MPRKPIKIEVVQEGDERFLVKIFADGSEERAPIVKRPRKPPRFPYRKVTFDKSRKKGVLRDGLLEPLAARRRICSRIWPVP